MDGFLERIRDETLQDFGDFSRIDHTHTNSTAQKSWKLTTGSSLAINERSNHFTRSNSTSYSISISSKHQADEREIALLNSSSSSSSDTRIEEETRREQAEHSKT
uniref:Uncharacterized protein n=1 Tax=Oryza sativa subsp. japonica TaxID=39947 RepID=Q69LE5_ORYSJ|nr:hypothetical protein [Oryza sativa Japonica Group]